MLGSQIVAIRAVWPESDPLEPSAFPKAFRMKAGMGRAIGCSFRPAYDAHRSIDRLTNSRVRATRCAFLVGNRSIIIDHRICSPIPKCVDPFRRTRFSAPARPPSCCGEGASGTRGCPNSALAPRTWLIPTLEASITCSQRDKALDDSLV